MAAALGGAAGAQTPTDLYQQALMQERTASRLDSAIALYRRVVDRARNDRRLAARALLGLGRTYEMLGRAEARAAYERLLREYGDQREPAAQARARIAALNPGARKGESGGAPASTAPLVRRISGDAHEFSSGAVSPDGRYVSYTDDATGDVAVLDVTSSQTRRITNKSPGAKSTDFAESSFISPNGLDIAYVWYSDSSGTGRYELRVIRADGGRARVVHMRDVGYLELYGWSPDGKYVLAVVKGNVTDHGALALIDVTTAMVSRLRNFAFTAAFGASFSPDGKWITFAVPANDAFGKNPAIRIIAADGSGEHALVDHPSSNWGPMLTPDGRGIAFRSDRTGNESLWFQEVVAGRAIGEPILLKSDMSGIWPLGFSRDGRLFYTATALRDISVVALDARTGEMHGSPKIVTRRFVGSNIDPDWSPDGQSLAFVSMRGPGAGMAPGTRKLVIVDLATGEQREFSPRLLLFQHPRWSRDGRSLLVVGQDTARNNGFFQLDAITGALTAMTVAPQLTFRPFEWSANGRSVFYARMESPRGTIWRYDLADSTHRPVYAPDSVILARAIAPSLDGGWIAFNATYRPATGARVERSQLLSLVTGELRDLPLPPPLAGGEKARRTSGAYAELAWLPDGAVLGVWYRRSDSTAEFWRVPINGGAPPMLAFESKVRMVTPPRLAPTGTRIAFAISRDDPNMGGVWTIENVLPPRTRTKNR